MTGRLREGRTRSVHPGTRPALLTILVLLLARPVPAQQARARRVDVGVGLRVAGTLTFDRVDAEEGRFGGPRTTVFSTQTAFGPVASPELRVGLRVTPTVAIESTASVGWGRLATTVSGDAEHAGGAHADERITEYRWTGGIVVRRGVGPSGRLTPFVAAGAGYERHLHEGRTLAQTGHSFHAGGGVEYPLGARPRIGAPSAGVRLELRATIPRGGLALDRSVHLVPAFGASLFARF